MDEKTLYEELTKVKDASYTLQDLDENRIKAVLQDCAAALRQNTAVILRANEADLARMDQDSPLYDRLLLNEERLLSIADDIEKIAALSSPVGEVIEERILPNGIDLSRVRVPLGVVGAIYEARPNVTIDIFSLCWRTQNACVLRGGRDAHDTNTAIVNLIQEVLAAHDIDPFTIYLMPPDRELMPAFLTAHGLVDVCIPRGSQALIDFVRENAAIPVIETGRGVVHIYFDQSGDLEKGAAIIGNAKTRRPSVCNSLDTLLVHKERLGDLETLLGALAEKQVHINADEQSAAVLRSFYPEELIAPANAESFDTEFLGLAMNVAVVDSAEDAMAHIKRYGSGHTESVLAEDEAVVSRFLKTVDAAVVMANVSTAFSDGGEFGLGAEIGISTQKLHARGPMGLEPLTSYKWILTGSGQVRPT